MITLRIARPRPLLFAATLLAGAVAPGRSGAAPDVQGTWLFRTNGASTFVDVSQTGNAVSFPFGGVTVAGTISDAGRLQASGGSPAENAFAGIDGDVSGDGTLMNASAITWTYVPMVFTLPRIFAQRCACTDGNLGGGDGCDADCQVEACWTCAGVPSVCTPAADGTPCQQSACTAGAVCTAATCGGGTPLAPCVDLSGGWWIHAVTSLLGIVTVADYGRDVRQRGGYLLMRDDPGGREYFGAIDASSGAMNWTRLSGYDASGLCSPTAQAYRLPYTGTATTSDAFTATGFEAVQVGRCPLPADVVETATRGTVPPSTTSTTATTSTTSTTVTTVPDLRTPISARKLTLRDDGVRRLVFKAVTRNDGTHVAPPAPLGPGDPTAHGATLDVYNAAGSGEHVQVVLPPERWRALPGGRGYVYAGAGTDPVTAVSVRTDRLSIRAGGAAFAYTLDEPQQGRIALALGLGSLPAVCTDVPARLAGRPPSSISTDRPGRFVGARTPAPPSCPAVP